MRQFQAMWNKISSEVSGSLSPASMRNQFPSTLGGWFKGNTDKDKTKRMAALSSFLEELCSTSILIANHNIYPIVEEFLEIDKNVTAKKGKVFAPRASLEGTQPRLSKLAATSAGNSSEGNPFG